MNFFGALVVDKFKVGTPKEGCKDLKDHLNDSRKEQKDEDKVSYSVRNPCIFLYRTESWRYCNCFKNKRLVVREIKRISFFGRFLKVSVNSL